MRRRERGAALLVAMVALVVVSIAAHAVHGTLVRSLHGFRGDRRAAQLRALSDAALADTLARLSSDPAFRGVPRRPLADGFLKSEVRPRGEGVVEVFATAEAAGVRSTAWAVVALEPTGPRVVEWAPSAAAVAR